MAFHPSIEMSYWAFFSVHGKSLVAQVFKCGTREKKPSKSVGRCSKKVLRERVEKLLDNGDIDLNDIVGVLVELEGWGRQQIYLYDWIGGTYLQNQWLNHDWVEDHFRRLNMLAVFNDTRPITEQDDSSLFTIKNMYGSQRIRFVWVQNRTSTSRARMKILNAHRLR